MGGLLLMVKMFDGENRCDMTVFHLKLGKDVGNMILYRAKAEVEQGGDLAVEFSFGHPEKHFTLAKRKTKRL